MGIFNLTKNLTTKLFSFRQNAKYSQKECFFITWHVFGRVL